MVNILIIDDEIKLCEAIASALNNSGFNARYINNPLLVMDNRIDYSSIDLIICDIKMPYINGIDLIKKINKENSIKVIFISVNDSEDIIIKGLETGAIDYITKPFSIKVLITKINNLFSQPKTIKYMDITIDSATRHVVYMNKFFELNLSEYIILEHMFKFPKVIHTREKLAEDVLKSDSLSNTVDVHICRIRKKLPFLKGRLITIPKLGYKLE